MQMAAIQTQSVEFWHLFQTLMHENEFFLLALGKLVTFPLAISDCKLNTTSFGKCLLALSFRKILGKSSLFGKFSGNACQQKFGKQGTI